MDKFVIVGGFLCFTANVFAIASVATPEWVVVEFAGSVRLGLTQMCQQSAGPGMKEICVTPELPYEWVTALVFMLSGVISLSTTCLLLVFSAFKPHLIQAARWITFAAMILFCLAALVFPLGFHMPEIGGEAFKLPNGTNVGTSFILFIFCIVFTIVSEPFIFKVCPLLLR